MKRLNFLRILCVGLLISGLVLVNGVGYAASDKENQGNHGQGNNGQNQGNQGGGNPENRGNGNQDPGRNNQGNQDQARGHSDSSPGQSRANEVRNVQATSHTSNSEIRRQAIERGRDQAILRANRPEKTNHAIGRNHEKGTGLKRALEKARWSYNPKDERGQGNMGKVDMKDPYGFDKDSGREGSERGRAIHPEPTLDLTSLLSLSVQITDPWYRVLLQQVEYWLAEANNPKSYYSQNTIQWYLSYWQNRLANYVPPAYDKVWVGSTTLPNTIYFSLDVSGLPETFEGTNLLVNMTLTSINDYTESFSFVDWSRRANSGEPNYYGWPIVTINYQYDAGQVAAEYTQEISLNGDGTYNFSYIPPATELSVGPKGGYFELAVTVTEPVSGTSYTMTYDREILLLRCPYGKVTDTKTGQTIAGAKVSVYFEDGSLVSLDKASNPTARNPQTTDATGRYGFKLETGRKYYISVAAPGYQVFRSPVFTEKWHVLREDIALTPIIK